VTNNGVFELSGANIGGNNRFISAGTFNWSGGTFSDVGTNVFASGSSLNISGGANKILSVRTLVNAGTATWTGTGSIYCDSAATFSNSGLFQVQNDASFVFNGGTGSTFINGLSGTFRKTLAAGTTTFDPNITFNNAGLLDLQSGRLSLSASYAPAASSLLRIVIGGTNSANFGQLQVAGTASLGTPLILALTNGFIPALTNTFQILSAGAVAGTFSPVSGRLATNGLYFTLTYAATSLTVGLADAASAFVPSVLALSAGQFQMKLSGVEGQSYEIQATTNLIAWVPISTNTISGGVVTFPDPSAGAFSNRFYRAVFNLP
jgi:hypothetical protein